MSDRMRGLLVLGSVALVGCGSSGSPGNGGHTVPPDAAKVDGAARDARASDGSARDGGPFTQERIVFLVETSGAMEVLDASKARVQAVSQVMQNHKGDPAVQFSVVTFNSSIASFPGTGFASAFGDAGAEVDTLLGQAASLTDYEDALDTVATLIDHDAMATSASTRAQTRYVVILLAGGTPDPQCSTEAAACGTATCTVSQSCWAGACSTDLTLCTIPRAQWGTAFDPPVNASLYPGLVSGSDFNTSAVIQQKAQSIAALKAKDQVGSVEVNAVLDFAASAAGNPLAGPFNLNRSASASLLQQVAQAGGGAYVDLSTTPELPF